jgi:hypothetical protein
MLKICDEENNLITRALQIFTLEYYYKNISFVDEIRSPLCALLPGFQTGTNQNYSLQTNSRVD